MHRRPSRHRPNNLRPNNPHRPRRPNDSSHTVPDRSSSTRSLAPRASPRSGPSRTTTGAETKRARAVPSFGSRGSSSLRSTCYFDAGAIAYDYVTLGLSERPWDKARRRAGGEIFGYFAADPFEPDAWKPGYQNPAFLRMTERDAAWMTRIVARFTPEQIERAVQVGDFTKPEHSAYLAATLIDRQRKILQRYFRNLSSIADLEVKDASLCGVDLARRSGVFPESAFRWSATIRSGEQLDRASTANVVAFDDGRLCIPLSHVASDGGTRDDAPSRYFGVAIANGASRTPLHAWLYDLGPTRGFRLVGLER